MLCSAEAGQLLPIGAAIWGVGEPLAKFHVTRASREPANSGTRNISMSTYRKSKRYLGQTLL